jgi:hypothetical protein
MTKKTTRTGGALAGALAELEKGWTSISNNLFPFQAFPDGGIANSIGEDDVFRDGADAPHAGLYEQHFAKPPFPKK